jgi:hypothetical protein
MGRLRRIGSSRRFDPLLQSAMIDFNDIAQRFDLPMHEIHLTFAFYLRLHNHDCHRSGLVGFNNRWPFHSFKPFKALPRRRAALWYCGSATDSSRSPCRICRRAPKDTSIVRGTSHWFRQRANSLTSGATAFFNLPRISLNPTIDRGMIDRYTRSPNICSRSR